MDDTRFVQNSPLAVPLAVVFSVWVIAVLLGSSGADDVLTAIGLAFVGLALFSLNRLSVRLDAGAIRVAFGLGFPRRVLPTSEVRTADAVRVPWRHGWGVRRVHGGWLWNVWGLSAVNLELDGGDQFLVGTNRPDELAAAISRRLVR